MLVLKDHEVCPHSARCPYAGEGLMKCQGTNPQRDQVFRCEYVLPNGKICDGQQQRNCLDVTGKMQLLID